METDVNSDNTTLSNSAIQNVLSNPEVLQQLMISQASCPSSEIQGIKIGDRILPVRVCDRDGQKIMQIVLPESPKKDSFKEEPQLLDDTVNLDMQNSANDSSSQMMQTIDTYMENINFSSPSLQVLPMQTESVQEGEMEFIQNTQEYEGMLPSTSEFNNQNYYNTSGSIMTEGHMYTDINDSKIDPELLNSFQNSLAQSSESAFIADRQSGDCISNQGIVTTSEGQTTEYLPTRDIVATAFEESGLLQATANVINAVKNHYHEEKPKKRRKIFEREQTQPLIVSKNARSSKVLYACNYGNCQRKFTNKVGLDIHLYTHTGLKPVTCKLCEKSFLNSKLFDKHKCKYSRPLQEMKGMRFECDICQKSFGNIGTLFVHKRGHKGIKPYTCGLCSKTFTLKPSMYKHVKSHGSDVRYKCQTCEEMFRSPWHLEEHLMSHLNEKKVYNCSQCTKVYTNYPNYWRHVKSHSIKGKTRERDLLKSKILTTPENISGEGLKCNVCLKSFTSVVGFQQHIQLHGPKRYQCTECKKRFVSRDYLQNHLQWYIAKFALGQTVSGHIKVIEKYKESNDLDIDDFLEMIETDEDNNSVYNNEGDPQGEETSKTYLCDMCGNYFFTERALTRHIKFHNDIPYKCSYCDKKFSFRANLMRHELTHTNTKEYECNLCDKTFTQKSRLEDHIKSHSAIRPYPCNLCNKKFSRISNLRRHKQLHSVEKKFECPECKRRFVCPRYLKEHVINVHTSMGRRKRECPICKVMLSGNSNLNRHLNLHYGTNDQNKKLECEICHKRFEFNSDMEIHLRSHTGEKPFYCETCSKSFMSMSNLRRHQTTHVESKSHVCEICGKAFKIERYLIDHRKIHTNPCKVTCEICNMSFSSNTNMKRHKLIHTGEKPFICPICNKAFRSKPDVERHRGIHFKEKSEQCHICSKKFKHKELLRRHLGKHERGVPTCDVCGKQFPTNYKLHRHQQTHQDNFICNVCETTFKTSLQLQKHVETHDIAEMRKLLLNMGSMKNAGNSPVKDTKPSMRIKQTGTVKTESNTVNSKKKLTVQPVSMTNLPLLAPNVNSAGTPIITVSQIPISGALTNVISIKDISQINMN